MSTQITGTWLRPDGTADVGHIDFCLVPEALAASGEQITGSVVRAELDGTGSIDVTLVPDADLVNVDGLALYAVRERVGGTVRDWWLHVADGDAIDLPSRYPGTDYVADAAVVPVPGPVGPQGERGDVGPIGPIGPEGPQGIPGLAGGSSIYRYNWGSTSALSDPGPGNVSIALSGGQGRTIAISGTDADGVPRNWALLQPGDNFTVTDDPTEEPITGFARYTITTVPEVFGGGTWFRVLALRTDTSGTTQPPPAGTPLRVAAALAGPSGLEPVIKTPATGRLSIAGIEMGDTGWRDITAQVTGSPTFVHLRRVGYTVSVSGAVDTVTGARATFPSGFRIAATSRLPVINSSAGDVGYHLLFNTGAWHTVSSSASSSFVLTWLTSNGWPTSLPGIPPAVQLPEPRG